MEKREADETWIRLRERLRWRERDARWLLEQWAQSGESLEAFARKHRLVLHRLMRWHDRLSKRMAAVPSVEAPRARLVPVAVRPTRVAGRDPGECPVVISAGAVRVEIHQVDAASSAWVAALLGSLTAAAASE